MNCTVCHSDVPEPSTRNGKCVSCRNKENTFVQKAFARLPSFSLERDRELTDRLLRRHYAKGWHIDDAVAFCKCLEDVNPTLDEAVALSRMTALRIKYGENTNEAISI